MPPEPHEVELQIVGVFEERLELRDQEQRIPLLLMRDPANRELRLPIGSCEALAIHVAFEDQLLPRPLTHDLALRLVQRLSAQLDRVVIDTISDDNFHATIHLHAPQGPVALEARPGDAIAIALRAQTPIYATEEVLARASQPGGDIR